MILEEEYECFIERNVMVPMRDGVRLAMDFYRPAKNGKPIKEKFPSLLVRTPYNKVRNQSDGIWFSKKGYTVCIFDIRGRFKSEGRFIKFENLDVDGYDTIEWIAKQEWSTGKVGTFGLSFRAHVQVAAATKNPPHLSAMVLTEGGYANAYLNGNRQGGAYEMSMLGWLYSRTLNSKESSENPIIKAALESMNFNDYLDPKRGQIKPGVTPFSLVPDYEKVLFDALTRSEYDDYWKEPWHSAELYYDNFSDVPTLIQTGWYDHFTLNDCMLYESLSKIKKGPIKLIIGPWTHGGSSLTYSGEVEFGPRAPLDVGLAPSYNHLRLRWFDRWLKGIENGAENDPAVRLFLMGGGSGARLYRFMQHGGQWINENDWPLPQTKYTNYYFYENGDLNLRPPTEEKSRTTYTYDPRDPVPTIGGPRDPHNMLGGKYRELEGPYDQIERPNLIGCRPPYVPLAFRNDVLVFKTPPLKQDLEVTGPIEVKLWASSTTVDTDFTAKLIDWYPPNIGYPMGFAMNLTEGIIRARYRNSWEKPELMRSGEVYEFKIYCYPTSNLFAKNHRIRVDISSSNWPRFDINPNTEDPPGRSRRFAVSDNTIYHCREYPSHIVLPMIER